MKSRTRKIVGDYIRQWPTYADDIRQVAAIAEWQADASGFATYNYVCLRVRGAIIDFLRNERGRTFHPTLVQLDEPHHPSVQPVERECWAEIDATDIATLTHAVLHGVVRMAAARRQNHATARRSIDRAAARVAAALDVRR